MRRALPFLLAACLAGCAELDGLQDSPIPDARPDPPAPVAQRSPESRRQEAFYKRVENRLLAEGLLRTDGGGPDVRRLAILRSGSRGTRRRGLANQQARMRKNT